MIKNIMNKNPNVSYKEVLTFLSNKVQDKKEREENRKRLMQKQLKEVTGDKSIIIANYSVK